MRGRSRHRVRNRAVRGGCASRARSRRTRRCAASLEQRIRMKSTARANFPSCAILFAAGARRLPASWSRARDSRLDRRRADGDSAQRHLHSLSERQQECDRRIGDRAPGPRDSRRACQSMARRDPAASRPTMPLANSVTRESPPAPTAAANAAAAQNGRGRRSRLRSRSHQSDVAPSEKPRPYRRRQIHRAAPRLRKNGRRHLRIRRCDECSTRSTRGWWN